MRASLMKRGVWGCSSPTYPVFTGGWQWARCFPFPKAQVSGGAINPFSPT